MLLGIMSELDVRYALTTEVAPWALGSVRELDCGRRMMHHARERGLLPKGFDGRGNYTLGLRDQLLFPEIDYMKADKDRGMNVSVVTTARTDEEARKLLQLLGMPFRKN